jgi:hypothetical protein
VALALVAAPSALAKRFAGVVPDVPTGTHLHPRPLAHAANLPYNGGPVLHSNRTWVIFWEPQGSGLSFDPGYEQQIITFLKRVAADSHKPTNVYGLSGQYHDSSGPAAYDSTYGGAVVATDPLLANGCTEPLTGPPWSFCVSDSQLEAELSHIVAADHLPNSGRDIYFLVTPNGLGDCETSGPSNCALGGSADGSYCGYHSSTPDGILYAVIPYNAVSGHCQSDNARPNASTADPTISTISHEHNETVTDPQATAWIDGSGNENGDLCITDYGAAPLGGSGLSAWNEVVGGGHYYLQFEWSNDSSSCQPRDESGSSYFGNPRRVKAGKPASLLGSASDPDGSIASYDWFFGDGRVGRHHQVTHTFKRAGVYRVVLRATDSSGNYAFFARNVTVARR